MKRRPNFVASTRIDNRLPELLANRKMSIRELSRESGITYTMIRDAYHGDRQSIKFDLLQAICKVLDVQPGDIYEYVEE